ncbi:MAG: class I SAM-dependent methyltransferase, partial [Lysinibacillus sp.]
NNVTVQTKLADLIHDDLPEAIYDGAVMIFGHFAKENQYGVLNKIMASLKPGGVFLLEVYEDGQLAYNTGGPRVENFLYNEQQLYEWAQSYHILHFFSGEVERYEGELHTGVCKVLQLIVKKEDFR